MWGQNANEVQKKSGAGVTRSLGCSSRASSSPGAPEGRCPAASVPTQRRKQRLETTALISCLIPLFFFRKEVKLVRAGGGRLIAATALLPAGPGLLALIPALHKHASSPLGMPRKPTWGGGWSGISIPPGLTGSRKIPEHPSLQDLAGSRCPPWQTGRCCWAKEENEHW